ncbi:MAG: aldehyde dehydrogenase family protein [Polyangiales bacterium]
MTFTIRNGNSKNQNVNSDFSEQPTNCLGFCWYDAVRRGGAHELSSIPCTDPATGDSLGHVGIDSPTDVAAAIARAHLAQQSWGKTSLHERARVLQAMLDFTVTNKDWICEQVQRDSGKTRENALVGEIWPTCEKFRWTIKNGKKHLKPERVSSGLIMHKKATLEYRPLGVIAAIIPWNYPFQNIVNPMITALMSGNAIVLKPSEWVSWSSKSFIDAFRAVLVDEGHPADLVQAVYGCGPTGAALARGDVNGILFIGSVNNGRRVIEASAERIVPVVMELGGKDAFIVCDDASIEQAAHAALAGCFINCGQNCVASERLLVHEKVYDAFEKRVLELVVNFRQGPGRDNVCDVGAIVSPLQLQLIEKSVQRAIEQGARIVNGAKRPAIEGNYYEPTILADVTPEMDIMNEEMFGPVMLLCKVRDDDEAIRIANSVSYGLSSSVFSKDSKRAKQNCRRTPSRHGGDQRVRRYHVHGARSHIRRREGIRIWSNEWTPRFAFHVQHQSGRRRSRVRAYPEQSLSRRGRRLRTVQRHHRFGLRQEHV